METYISIKDLIEKLEKNKVDLGKGDPYNRLRYYTKMGWLPHMERKKTKSGKLSGHYPNWVLKRITTICNFKKQGLSNDEVAKKINTQNQVHSLYNNVNSVEFRKKISKTIFWILLSFVLANEFGLINISKSKKDTISQTINDVIVITRNGKTNISKGMSGIFVKDKYITQDTKVYVTFTKDYFPATRYWVESINAGEGFYLKLDSPTTMDTEFTWWTSN